MRDPIRKAKRDQAIVEAFYKLFDIERLRVDDAIKELSDEIFFLDPEYIYAVIFYNKENREYYTKLVDGNLKPPKRKILTAVTCR